MSSVQQVSPFQETVVSRNCLKQVSRKQRGTTMIQNFNLGLVVPVRLFARAQVPVRLEPRSCKMMNPHRPCHHLLVWICWKPWRRHWKLRGSPTSWCDPSVVVSSGEMMPIKCSAGASLDAAALWTKFQEVQDAVANRKSPRCRRRWLVSTHCPRPWTISITSKHRRDRKGHSVARTSRRVQPSTEQRSQTKRRRRSARCVENLSA